MIYYNVYIYITFSSFFQNIVIDSKTDAKRIQFILLSIIYPAREYGIFEERYTFSNQKIYIGYVYIFERDRHDRYGNDTSR